MTADEIADLMGEFSPEWDITVHDDPPVIIAIRRPTPTASRTLAAYSAAEMRAKIQAAREGLRVARPAGESMST